MSQQAIDMGKAKITSRLASIANVQVSKKENNAAVEEPHYVDSNSSISSIDSTDSTNCNALLQECIQIGITKANKPIESTVDSTPSLPPRNNANQQKRSQLPMFKASSGQMAASNHRSRSTKREDEQLLLDCINTGIERNIRLNAVAIENTPPNHLKQQQQQQSNAYSKNVQTTSAIASRIVGATDVVIAPRKGTGVCAQDRHQLADFLPRTMTVKTDHEASTPAVGHTNHAVSATQTEIGSNNTSTLNTSMLSTKSHNSFNMMNGSTMLERSNEYPACLSQTEGISDSMHSSSVDMEISNECLFENTSPHKIDKHKDPDLMIQSMERLTHEFVSTAEYLRTANSNDDDTTTTTTDNKISGTSNNTWNEDTHPNEVSFPSISQTVPMIASMHDDDTTISDSNAASRYEMAYSQVLDEPTPTNDCKTFVDGINDINDNQTTSNSVQFEIGGQINQMNFVCSSMNSHETNSTMTNSTIIAMEANKIRSQIMKDSGRADSIVSLDKIRPPSVMEKMNNSSYCDSMNGASSLKNSPARHLTQGFMARRAILNNNAGSMDSINSSCNLDRVKPPSLMDELLDSMISVDSIASEVIDNNLQQPQHEEHSNYETAFSECDDMSTTLKCCTDLPMDGHDSTPCGSDFSSAETTPKKVRRSLTPRRKRQITKERYQTYTIATAENEVGQQSTDPNECYVNGAAAHGSSSNYFQMDISNHTFFMNDNDSDAISLVSTDDGDMSSIRAFTRNLPYLNDANLHLNDTSINTNTYTKHNRFVTAIDSQATPTPSGDFFESLPMDNGSGSSSKTQSPNHTYTKSPRIIKPSAIAPNYSGGSQVNEPNDVGTEPKAIRGRKKPAYVSPYSMTKLTKSSPIKVTSPAASKTVSPKPDASKSPQAKPVEAKAKSIIQRGAESLAKKMRPSFTSKLSKQSVAKKSPTTSNEKISLDRQRSSESTKSSETLIRQSTFIKDEPSEGEIPVIVSEPTSPKKTKTLISKIPFNRATSLQATRNVTKCKTNIEIPSQKSASTSFTKRNLKAASSTSQIALASAKSPLSPRSSIDSTASNSKCIFKKWSPPKTTTALTSKVAAIKTPTREPVVATTAKKLTGISGIKSPTSIKPSKIATNRPITTNGRTTRV